MADEYSFLQKKKLSAVLIAPPLGISNIYMTKGFNLCRPNPALCARSFREFRRVVKSRYLATDGIG